jgi:lysophospholipase L1-like esterase
MKRLLAAALLWCLAAGLSHAADGLKPGDYVAVIGDSITEQKQYSVFIQDYLLMCQPVTGLRTTQFGWSGETAGGFLGRMENDALRFKPSVATTCYGMNDGGYSPSTPDKSKRYFDAQVAIVKKMKEAGVRFIVVGAPGCVDTDFFRKDPKNPNNAAEMSAMYNKTLGDLRDLSKKAAEQEGVAFANVFDAMHAAMGKAKAKYGAGYHLCGGDGFHPDANGHLVMAYAFLKGLGCSGDIGTITVDLGAGSAQATDGHKVLSAKDGVVELESTRYPFCFYGDPKSPGATRGVIEFFPFNDELNRYQLVVKGAKGGQVKVTWGAVSKEFPAEQLAKGINLAAEFLDNPFSEPFRKVEEKIRAQQNFETPLVKDLINKLPRYKQFAPDEAESVDRIAAKLVAKDKEMAAASSAAVMPVKHTLKIEAAK